MKTNEIRNIELKRNDEGILELVSDDMHVSCDFTRMIHRIKRPNLQRELLVKAAKISDFVGAETLTESDNTDISQSSKIEPRLPLAIDMTAGLGEDSLLLAAAGFRVLMFEKDPTIAALLRDGLSHAISDADMKLLSDAASRMTLIEGDSIEALGRVVETFDETVNENHDRNVTATHDRSVTANHGRNIAGTFSDLTERPDIILLDPMFPEKQKNSLTKKKLQLIQMLERPCEDEEALLEAAISAGPHKIIIKRPLKGPYLAGRKPTYSLEGKTVRIDCILI